MKKAWMFDLDGTLINSLQDIADSMNKALEAFGLPPHATEKYRLFTGDGALNLTRRALGENHQALVEDVLRTYAGIYAQGSRVKTAPYAGIRETLLALHQKGFQLMVLSNKDDSDVKNVVRHYFPDIPFALVQGREEGFAVKPDPALGMKMLQRMNLSPEELFYAGDTATDMRCAKNLGATAVAVLWGFQTEERIRTVGAAYFAKAPADLIRIAGLTG